MCTRFYVEPMSTYHGLIEKAQRTALAPNKEGRMAVYPMLWGVGKQDG